MRSRTVSRAESVQRAAKASAGLAAFLSSPFFLSPLLLSLGGGLRAARAEADTHRLEAVRLPPVSNKTCIFLGQDSEHLIANAYNNEGARDT